MAKMLLFVSGGHDKEDLINFANQRQGPLMSPQLALNRRRL
jgi:hypothetical protein